MIELIKPVIKKFCISSKIGTDRYLDSMDEPNTDDQKRKKFKEKTTFTIPFALEKINKTIIVQTNTKKSKEQTINQAIKFYSKGNIIEASKYLKSLIDQGVEDQRLFLFYGAILQGLGKSSDAEIYTCQAITLNPNIGLSHFNLGNILRIKCGRKIIS